MPRIELFIAGRPVPKPQKYTHGGHKQWTWRKHIQVMVLHHHQTHDDGVRWPVERPVRLGMRFHMLQKGITRLPDWKNLYACCEDALTGVVYVDDFLVEGPITNWESGRYVVTSNAAQGMELAIEY